jgi:hypothetical protein
MSQTKNKNSIVVRRRRPKTVSRRVVKNSNQVSGVEKQRLKVRNRVRARNNNNPSMRTMVQTAPNAIGSIIQRMPPVISARNGKTVINHSEPLGKLLGSVAFVNTQFAVNPGLISMFPWMGLIGYAWEAYHFTKLVVHFFTSKGTNVTGVVAIAPEFDVADGPPISLQAIEQEQGSSRGAPWTNFSCRVDPTRVGMGMIGPRRYIRSGNVPTGRDSRLYDVCNINIGVEGMADATAVGEIWLEYEVELDKPTVNSVASSSMTGGASSTGVGSVSSTNVLGTSPTFFGRLSPTASLNLVTFNNMIVGLNYMLTLVANGTVFSAAWTMTVSSGATQIQQRSAVNVAATLDFCDMSFVATSTTVVMNINSVPVTWTTLANVLLICSLCDNALTF